MPGFEDQEGVVEDLQGNWWYQDVTTASWYMWIGQSWKKIPGAAPRIPPGQIIRTSKLSKSKLRLSKPIMLTLLTAGIIALIVIGGVTLVAYNFFSAYHINAVQSDLNQILKLAGWGLLATILGLLMLARGFRTILPNRSAPDDDWIIHREKPGCQAILNSLGQLFFGTLFLTGGLGLITVVIYQNVLPWLGL